MKNTPKISILTPFWAVGRECGCTSIILARFHDSKVSQWACEVTSLEKPPFLAISPLVIKTEKNFSLGTDAREPIIDNVLEEMEGQFKGAPVQGCFDSGPITALFPHSRFDMAWECAKFQTMLGSMDMWKESTERVLKDLSALEVPFLQL
ncbi:MAG: hypothetical protein Q7S34_04030 [bacterium]|nr:hypothetical protein [bacterium]